MPVLIPMKNIPSFIQETTLDTIPYILRFDYNARGVYWSLSISSIDETVLLSGLKLVLHYELLHRFQGRGLPPGELWVIDPTNNLSKIEKYDFTNDRLSLVYYEESEIEI